MIILHKKLDHPESENLEGKLIDLVLAYEIISYPADKQDPGLPYIEESGRTYKGSEEISQWLLTLEEELSWQRSLSGDACYINPETGRIC